MTPEAQNTAIAEILPGATGWVVDNCGLRVCPLQFTTDLNAMHEAEKVLTRDQMDAYANELFTMLPCDENHGPLDMDDSTAGDVMTPSMFQVSHAAAAQRAEAFLRTIGKWEDGK